MLVPLYGFLRGDTLGILVLVDSEDTLGHVADTLVRAAAVRVAPVLGQRIWRDGHPLDPELTVTRAGFVALDRIDVAPEPA